MKKRLTVLIFFGFFVISCFSNRALATNWNVGTTSQFSNAITNSVSGDTITVTSDIITPANSYITDKSITIQSDETPRVLNGNGRGNLRFSNGKSSIDGISFTNMNCAIYNQNNSSLTIGDGVSFSTNTSNNGAAIYNDSSFMKIGKDVVFSSNTAKSGCGAVYSVNNSTMTIGDKAVFNFNTGIRGGGVYNAYSSTMTIGDGAVFSSNTVKNNNIISSGSGGGVTNSDDSIMIIGDGVAFSANKASLRGGGVYNAVRSTMTIGDEVFFSSNTSVYGGAVYNNDSVMTIGDKAKFVSNEGTYGAAVYNQNSADLTIGNDAVFSSNTAETNAGAISNIRASVAIGTGATFSSNTAKTGGAIMNGTDGILTIGDNAKFLSNFGRETSGAIQNINNASLSIGQNAIFSLNTAGGDGGGGISNRNGSSVIIGNNAFFQWNTAGKTGGAIYNIQGSTMTIGDGVVFSSNTANLYGGAIYNINSSSMTIGKNAVFSSNTAGDHAGAISNQRSYMIIDSGVTFSSNAAVISAGALYNGDNGLVEIGDESIFEYNSAGNDGGALYNIGRSTLTIGNNAIISYNTAGNRGGGLFTGTNSVSKIGDGVVFSSNAAKTGGAIHNIFDVEIGSKAEFSYNTAVSSGGAIYNVNGATMTVGDEAIFNSNTAGESGGAIYLGNGIINMKNPIFLNNEAGKLGGAVYVNGENEKAEMNIKITEDIIAEGNTANGVDNVFYLAQKADLNLDIDSGVTLSLMDGVVSENNDTAVTKTGEGVLLLGSANNRIDGILNIFGGEIKTGYSIGSGNIFFDNSALLHITDDIEMENNIYAKSGGVQDITIQTDDGIKLTMSGVMGIGNETLNKNGTGSMIFDTASSTNLLKTNLTEGILRVLTDDYVSENVDVSNGATLSGTGKITGDVVNKGMVSPGKETGIGRLKIDGNYLEQGILGVRLYQDETPANDLLLVSGNADIDNVSKIYLDLRYGFKIGEEYTILTALSGLNGIYDGFVNDLSSFDILISSDMNNVYLKINSVNTNYSSLSNLSHNQKEVSKAIDKITNGTDSEIKEKISKILGTTEPLDEAGKKAVFDEMAGCIYANMLYAAADNSGRKQLYNQINKKINREGPTTCTYNLWGQMYGSHIIRDTDSNSINKFTDNSAYAMIGWDNYCDEDDAILGYVVEFGKHKGTQGDDEFEMNDYKGGIYFGSFGERWNFKSSLMGGYQQYEVDREQKLLETPTESEYSGYSVNAVADLYYVAYQTEGGNFSLSPFGGLEGNFVYTKAFTEKAKGNAASWLDVKENNFVIADAKLGFRVENISKLRWYAELSGKCNLAGEKGTFKAKINGLDDEVEIFGLKNGMFSGKLEAGLDFKLGDHFDIFVVGTCEQAEKFGKYSGHIGVNYGW